MLMYRSTMVVSMLQIIFELPETTSLKDKRRIVKAVKERTSRRFNVSCAEVDLQDSLRFAQLGSAIVSNSREFGEKVMAAILTSMEEDFHLRIHDAQVHSEFFE